VSMTADEHVDQVHVEDVRSDSPPGVWANANWSGAWAGRGGPDFGRMIAALRLVQDRVAAANPPPSVVADVADRLDEVASLLEPHEVAERQQIAGRRLDLPGRGQSMLPTFTADEWDDDHVRGRVTFTRFYLGGNGAAHGGTIPLLFDDVLGRLANMGGRPPSRTAYLNVDFRKITPIGRELRVQARFDREEGRKRFLSGEIYDGDAVTAEAGGLFVALRPGQP